MRPRKGSGVSETVHCHPPTHSLSAFTHSHSLTHCEEATPSLSLTHSLTHSEPQSTVHSPQSTVHSPQSTVHSHRLSHSHRRTTTDHRPPTTDERTTTDHRPPTDDRRTTNDERRMTKGEESQCRSRSIVVDGGWRTADGRRTAGDCSASSELK